MEKEKMPWSTAEAQLTRAGAVVAARGDDARAIALLRSAVAGLDGAGMQLYAAASRRCLGKMLGGDEGRALIDAADAWMREEGIAAPARVTAVLAPGFSRLD
jgi:hypothetical protein